MKERGGRGGEISQNIDWMKLNSFQIQGRSIRIEMNTDPVLRISSLQEHTLRRPEEQWKKNYRILEIPKDSVNLECIKSWGHAAALSLYWCFCLISGQNTPILSTTKIKLYLLLFRGAPVKSMSVCLGQQFQQQYQKKRVGGPCLNPFLQIVLRIWKIILSISLHSTK